MKIDIRHEAGLNELTSRQPAFTPLARAALAPIDYRRWARRGGREDGRDMHIIHVSFIGKSGYGKSSLVNAIVGAEVMETSAVDACTRAAQNATFRIRDDHFLSFADVPGIGESTARDAAYLELYEALVARSDVVVHVLRADCRDYAVDQAAFQRLFPTHAARRRVILTLNACDKIEPLDRNVRSGPSAAQLTRVHAKQGQLRAQFPGVHDVIPCCANPAWNLGLLTQTISTLLLAAPGVGTAAA